MTLFKEILIFCQEEFNDNAKDAGTIGAGHAVKVIYEILPECSDF